MGLNRISRFARRVQGKKIDHVDELYDSFKVKDLTRAQFRAEYARVTNVKKASKDLSDIVMQRQIRNQISTQRKEQIGSRIRHGGGVH